jgi:hypothetical protein
MHIGTGPHNPHADGGNDHRHERDPIFISKKKYL